MRKQHGFTLIEVIFSLAILAVGVLGSFAAVNACMTAQAYNQEYIIAVNAARAQYERICNQVQQSTADFENLLSDYGYGKLQNTFDAQVVERGADQTGGTADDKIKRLNLPLDSRINGANWPYDDQDPATPFNRKAPGPDGVMGTTDDIPMLGWIDFPVSSLTDTTMDERIAPNPAGPDYDTKIERIARDLGMPRDLDLDGNADDFGLPGPPLPGPDAILGTADDICYRFLPIRITIRWQGATGVREYKLCSAVYRPAKVVVE